MNKYISFIFFIFLGFKLYSNSYEIKYSLGGEKKVTGKPFKIVFFSCKSCELELSYSDKIDSMIDEIGNSFFIISSKKKEINIDDSLVKGIEVEFVSFVSGEALLPEINFLVTSFGVDEKFQKSFSSKSTQSISGIKLKFSSELKDKQFSELYGKITFFDIVPILALLIGFAFLLILFFHLRRKFKALLKNKKTKKPLSRISQIRDRVVSVKKFKGSGKDAYFELSECLRTWIEFKFAINAHKMLPHDIVMFLEEKDKELADKISEFFSRIKNPVFSGIEVEKKVLLIEVDFLLEILDEF